MTNGTLMMPMATSGLGMDPIEYSVSNVNQEGKMLSFIRNEEELVRLAKLLDAGGLLKKKGIQNPSMLFSVLAFGWDFGWGPWETIRNCHVIDGAISMASQTKMALAVKHGVKFAISQAGMNGNPGRRGEWVEVKATREGFPDVTVRWDDEDVKRAGLNRGPTCNHAKFPEKMKTWRAVSDACDYICPDLFCDIYAPDEVHQITQKPRSVEVIETTIDVSPAPLTIDSVVGVTNDPDMPRGGAKEKATRSSTKPPKSVETAPSGDLTPPEPPSLSIEEKIAEIVAFFVKGLGVNQNSLESIAGAPIEQWPGLIGLVHAFHAKVNAIKAGGALEDQFTQNELTSMGLID